jgi:hypothetical protein
MWAGIAQSIQQLVTGWTVRGFFAPVQTGPGAHTASYTMGTGSFPEVKRPRRRADHPPASRAELRKE